MEEVKMFLFARWISLCYADTHLDGISILNVKDGDWYKQQLKYFNNVVYPNYIKNGSVDNAKKFLVD